MLFRSMVFNGNPLFVDAANGNLRLQPGSPAIDAGTATGAPAFDFDYNFRPLGVGYDMGCFEGQPSCTPYADNIIYVNDDATGANTGASWANAMTDLQAALATAGACSNITQIWVAEGTYKPTSGSDRDASFELKNGLAVYGGFPNTGNPGLNERNWRTHVTTLSGDIGTPGNNSDNSHHVVSAMMGPGNGAVLDGFTITGGNAGSGFGGGMIISGISSPTVRNCIFTGNTASLGAGTAGARSVAAGGADGGGRRVRRSG